MATWMEQEADEVGYEFFLRAGLKASEYGENHLRSLRSVDQVGYEACLAQLSSAAHGGPVKSERSSDSHPSECWRAYDIRFLEAYKHEADYVSLLPHATEETVFPGEMAKVKAAMPRE